MVYKTQCWDCGEPVTKKRYVARVKCDKCTKRKRAERDKKRRKKKQYIPPSRLHRICSCNACGTQYQWAESENAYWCKSCTKARQKERKSKFDKRWKLYDLKKQGYKQCGKCDKVKQFSEFHKDSQQKDGHHSYCKECVAKYHQDNRDTLIESAKQWQRENPKRQAESARRWRKKNPDKVLANTKIQLHRRRARENELPNDFNQFDWEHALEYFNGCCAVCGRQMNDMFGEFTAAQDHWIPISYDGDDNPGNVPHNIVPLCHGVDGCNNSKHAKLPDEWLKEKFGTRKANQIMKQIQEFFETVRKV